MSDRINCAVFFSPEELKILKLFSGDTSALNHGSPENEIHEEIPPEEMPTDKALLSAVKNILLKRLEKTQTVIEPSIEATYPFRSLTTAGIFWESIVRLINNNSALELNSKEANRYLMASGSLIDWGSYKGGIWIAPEYPESSYKITQPIIFPKGLALTLYHLAIEKLKTHAFGLCLSKDHDEFIDEMNSDFEASKAWIKTTSKINNLRNKLAETDGYTHEDPGKNIAKEQVRILKQIALARLADNYFRAHSDEQKTATSYKICDHWGKGGNTKPGTLIKDARALRNKHQMDVIDNEHRNLRQHPIDERVSERLVQCALEANKVAAKPLAAKRGETEERLKKIKKEAEDGAKRSKKSRQKSNK